MKMLKWLVALLFVCVGLYAQTNVFPGMPLKTNVMYLCWDVDGPEKQIDYYRIWVRTNFPVTMPQTNNTGLNDLLIEDWDGVHCGEGSMQWWPTGVDTNGWEPILVVTNRMPDGTLLGVSSCKITNRWSVSGVPVFLVVTSKNYLGETPFSNVAWIPAPPSHRDRGLRLLSVE